MVNWMANDDLVGTRGAVCKQLALHGDLFDTGAEQQQQQQQQQ
jgi:hypothetical protein